MVIKKKKNHKSTDPLNTLLHTCAWCKKSIPQDAEVFVFGAKANPGIDLSDKEGEFVSLKLALIHKTLVALVTVEGSPSREAGYDLMFVTCSQKCAQDLKDSLESEKGFIDNPRKSSS